MGRDRMVCSSNEPLSKDEEDALAQLGRALMQEFERTGANRIEAHVAHVDDSDEQTIEFIKDS